MIEPSAEGGINRNVPIYKYMGISSGFDVAKDHVSFGRAALKDEDGKMLEAKGYKNEKVQFISCLTRKC